MVFPKGEGNGYTVLYRTLLIALIGFTWVQQNNKLDQVQMDLTEIKKDMAVLKAKSDYDSEARSELKVKVSMLENRMDNIQEYAAKGILNRMR
jgi:cob(I)alamin adenosyltransferase